MDNAPPVDHTTNDAHPTLTPSPSEEVGSESIGGGRRTTLAVAALLTAFMTYLAVGIATMDIPSAAKWPDARFFPTVVCIIGYCVSALLVLQAWRSAQSPPFDRDTHEQRVSPRWRSVVMAIATLVVFAGALEPAGWLLSGTLLFWGIAVSLGSRRFLFDAAVAAVVSSSVQLAFSAGLGLHLPVGILGAF